MENCLVTNLKGTADNNSLKRFNRIRVTLSFPNGKFTYLMRKGRNNGGIAGEKISGNLFRDAERTTPITKELYIPNSDYSGDTIFNGDQPNNPNHSMSVIDLVQDNIWIFGTTIGSVLNPVDNILNPVANIGYVWYSVDWEALCYSSAAIVNVSTMYLTGDQNDANIEDFFVKRFRRIKYSGVTIYEDATAQAYFPCVINGRSSIAELQKRVLFNKQPFFNRQLFMSTDINNDRFTLYDTASNFVISVGYNISNPVASYNNSTDEWTYNL